jgi:PhnB protein
VTCRDRTTPSLPLGADAPRRLLGRAGCRRHSAYRQFGARTGLDPPGEGGADASTLYRHIANASDPDAKVAPILYKTRCRIPVETGSANFRGLEWSEVAITGSAIHLTVDGADAASAWYSSALSARERSRITLPGGKLIHVELLLGDLAVMLADEFPDLGSFGPKHLGGTYGAIYLHVDDVDAVWDRVLDAGATVVRPLADAFWGERDGQILDPFGHRWGLTQHVRDVSIAEMQELATAAFAESGGDP